MQIKSPGEEDSKLLMKSVARRQFEGDYNIIGLFYEDAI